MLSINVTTLIATLAALATAESYPACTTTLTPDINCCAGPAGHTSTSLVDCDGCWLYTPYPTVCDMVRCASPTGVVADRTTTVTSCAASPTPTMETYVRREDPEYCVTRATKTTPGCGDCGQTIYASTKTLSVDCNGCALQTVDAETAGICVCATETTEMVCMASPTIS